MFSSSEGTLITESTVKSHFIKSNIILLNIFVTTNYCAQTHKPYILINSKAFKKYSLCTLQQQS